MILQLNWDHGFAAKVSPRFAFIYPLFCINLLPKCALLKGNFAMFEIRKRAFSNPFILKLFQVVSIKTSNRLKSWGVWQIIKICSIIFKRTFIEQNTETCFVFPWPSVRRIFKMLHFWRRRVSNVLFQTKTSEEFYAALM